MARGKYLSLEEARKANQLKQFGKEHVGLWEEHGNGVIEKAVTL